MWTETTRPKYERKGVRYTSDVTDAEWAVISRHLPEPKLLGRPRGTELREVVNALFYMARTGCQWKLLPSDLPHYSTVQYYFYSWRDNGVWSESISNCYCRFAKPRVARQAPPPGSSIANRSRPPRAVVPGDMMRAKR